GRETERSGFFGACYFKRNREQGIVKWDNPHRFEVFRDTPMRALSSFARPTIGLVVCVQQYISYLRGISMRGAAQKNPRRLELKNNPKRGLCSQIASTIAARSTTGNPKLLVACRMAYSRRASVRLKLR